MFRLLAASLLCASAMHAQLATAVGVVVDSVHGRALVGATIVVSGAEVQGVSDSSGRFRIDSIPAGDHTMAVLHPLLDEMGLTLQTNKIAFAPGATLDVILATPSAATWIARRCSDAERQLGTDAIIGHVLQLTSDDPVTGALVHYTGVSIEVGVNVGLQHTTVTRDAAASPSGDFVVCGVPRGTSGTIRATKGRVSTGDVPVDLSSAPLAVVTLRLAPNDTLAIHAGVVRGRIVDDKGAPVPAARVTLHGGPQGTQTSDSGTFALRELPLGSQILDIEKVGFPKTGVALTILGPQQPTVVAIALPAPPARSVDATLVSVGFVQRRAAGGGVFITADTIQKRNARYIADLQPLMPDLIEVSTQRGPLLVPTHAAVARCIWYLVDGLWYEANSSQYFMNATGGQINDAAPAGRIAGIEYYQYGHIPKDLLDRVRTRGYPRCSMIAVWTDTYVGTR
ncbi:MAG TPA: carboxypeptidase regulatory-like domain-containing protein [Gemmatimonadaceae bacterium]|nr:carboxypeptidase regulatory-like domain-containing protein [Gemmatimonadaceae bacterium]